MNTYSKQLAKYVVISIYVAMYSIMHIYTVNKM